jgi:hypothetical protein
MSLVMACDQGAGRTSAGCEGVKEVLVTLPDAEEGTDNIDKYEIELIDAVSMERLEKLEALPGESKAASIVDTGAPVTIRATAVDENGNTVAEAESTNLIGFEHDGLLCDFSVNVNRDEDQKGVLEITMDCNVIEIMKKAVQFVRDNFENVVQVSIYLVKDAVEDMKNIIEIWDN